jgi:hypothetical protein
VLPLVQTQAVPTLQLKATHQPSKSVIPVVPHQLALLEMPAQSLPRRTLTVPLLARLNAKLMLLANRKPPFLMYFRCLTNIFQFRVRYFDFRW